jgi:hypothetical protein
MESYGAIANRPAILPISLEDSNFLIDLTNNWFSKRQKRSRNQQTPEEGSEDAARVPDNAERSKLLNLLSCMASDSKSAYNISFLNVISLHLVPH